MSFNRFVNLDIGGLLARLSSGLFVHCVPSLNKKLFSTLSLYYPDEKMAISETLGKNTGGNPGMD